MRFVRVVQETNDHKVSTLSDEDFCSINVKTIERTQQVEVPAGRAAEINRFGGGSDLSGKQN